MELQIETTAIADAVNRAARVAPTKGAAFDKAAGIMLETDQSEPGMILVKATDLEVTYRQRVPATITGDGTWRVPSSLISGVLGGLPMSGEVKFEELSDGRLRITHGRTRATLNQITGMRPLIDAFDATDLVSVDDFAKRAAQVTWACHGDSAPLSGVHINGTELVACDRTKLAMVPCVVPVVDPITVPLSTLTALLRNTGSMKIGAVERRLRLMPDPDTQITAVIYAAEYPNYKAILRDTFDLESHVDRAGLSAAITRMLVLVKGERYPLIQMIFEEDQVQLLMQVPEVGLMEDAVALDSGPFGAFTIWFTPQNIVAALEACSTQQVLLKYGPTPMHSLSISDGLGYDALIMPRNVGTASAAAA